MYIARWTFSTGKRLPGGRAHLAPLPLDPRQLDVPRAEHLGHRGPLPLLRLLIEGGEALPLGEGAGEIGLVPLDPLEQSYLHENDGPGNHGETDQENQDQLDDWSGQQDMLQYLRVEQPAVAGTTGNVTSKRNINYASF